MQFREFEARLIKILAEMKRKEPENRLNKIPKRKFELIY